MKRFLKRIFFVGFLLILCKLVDLVIRQDFFNWVGSWLSSISPYKCCTKSDDGIFNMTNIVLGLITLFAIIFYISVLRDKRYALEARWSILLYISAFFFSLVVTPVGTAVVAYVAGCVAIAWEKLRDMEKETNQEYKNSQSRHEEI